MEPEGSLPHSQKPGTCLRPEPDKSTPCLPVLEDIFMPSFLRLGLPSSLFPLGLPTEPLYAPHLSPVRATRNSAHEYKRINLITCIV